MSSLAGATDRDTQGDATGRWRKVMWYSFRASLTGDVPLVWHLIEDFFEQGVIVKLFIAVGWLAVVIMLASLARLVFA